MICQFDALSYINDLYDNVIQALVAARSKNEIDVGHNCP